MLGSDKAISPHKFYSCYIPPYYFSLIYASLGDRDRALEWLEKEYQEGHYGVVNLKIDPHFDGLRSDPRFQDIVRRMNFAS